MIEEIIETYWNVNEIVEMVNGKTIVEIIETYWNVNYMELYLSIHSVVRNNRNILECKLDRIS